MAPTSAPLARYLVTVAPVVFAATVVMRIGYPAPCAWLFLVAEVRKLTSQTIRGNLRFATKTAEQFRIKRPRQNLVARASNVVSRKVQRKFDGPLHRTKGTPLSTKVSSGASSQHWRTQS